MFEDRSKLKLPGFGPPWLMYGFSYATAIKISHVAGNLAFDNY